jgi:hypothetical protein
MREIFFRGLARLSGFDDALLLLRTAPCYPSQGMVEDVTYAIDKHVVAIEEEESQQPRNADAEAKDPRSAKAGWPGV